MRIRHKYTAKMRKPRQQSADRDTLYYFWKIEQLPLRFRVLRDEITSAIWDPSAQYQTKRRSLYVNDWNNEQGWRSVAKSAKSKPIRLKMPGTRHGKNQTSAPTYTYYERLKDAKQGGHGTLHARFGADSIRDFDCCCLSLQPCREPLVSPDGYVFDKEVVLEYILNTKKANARKMKEWEAQEKRDKQQEEDHEQAEFDKKVKDFEKCESTPAFVGATSSDSRNEQKRAAKSEKSGLMGDRPDPNSLLDPTKPNQSRKRPALTSFWVPSVRDESKVQRLEKPDMKVYCPVTKKPFKFKDLMPIKFTLLPEDDDNKISRVRKARHMCPITHDVLTNAVPCAVLKTSGNVVTMECVKKIIRKDWIDPTNNKKVTEDDIIELKRGGTGFSAVNAEELKGSLRRTMVELI